MSKITGLFMDMVGIDNISSRFHEEGVYNICARDCQDVRAMGFTESGVYRVTPEDTYEGFEVYCDMETDQGGWLVFQRREDGSENFDREWSDYQAGFGSITGEHWLGNLALHAITSQGLYELRVDLEDFEGETRFAKYRIFRVKHTEELYKLVIEGYSGNSGNSLGPQNGMAFTTKDRDNDVHETVNCASHYKGAGWLHACLLANVNGQYLHGNHTSFADGLNWDGWKGLYYSLKSICMKIRRI